MKKLLRLFTSGLFLILLFLLVEVLVLIVIDTNLDTVVSGIIVQKIPAASRPIIIVESVLLFVRVVSTIAAIVVFFRIINRFEDPEFKIPWLIFLLALPLTTILFFLIFADHGLKNKEKKIYKKVYENAAPYFEINDQTKEKYIDELGHAVGSFAYIANTAHMGIHKNNRVTYYKNGEEFFPAMIEGLKKAKEFIFIEFFIITDGKLWNEVKDILIQKAQAGVDIKIVYDDMGCMGTISPRTPKRLAKYGIHCYKFHKFQPLLRGMFNNRDHRKIVVVDHQMAFTGGCNLADEYANIIKRFGYWKDTMVKIEGSAINNLITTFLENYAIAKGAAPDYSRYLNYEYPEYKEEGFVMPFGDGPGGIDDALIGEQNYINILNYAREKVYISSPYLVPTYSLIDALRNAAKRGVDVRLILPGIPDKKLVYKVAKASFRPLLEAGVKIYLYTPGFNHMKSMLADDELGFVGTINLDFRSLVHHFECGTLLYKNPCLKDIHDDFEEMLAQSEQVPENFKLGLFSRSVCGLIKIITPLL